MKMPKRTLHKSEAGFLHESNQKTLRQNCQENWCKDNRSICYEIYVILLKFTLNETE